jgi:hypothetical protein
MPPKLTHNEHLRPKITWVIQQVLKVLIYVYKELMLVLMYKTNSHMMVTSWNEPRYFGSK